MWRLIWRVIKYLFGIGGLIATYSSLVAQINEVQLWGLSWAWYALIGITILLIVLGVVIGELYSENKKLKSKDAEQERRIKDKQEAILDWEKQSRGI